MPTKDKERYKIYQREYKRRYRREELLYKEWRKGDRLLTFKEYQMKNEVIDYVLGFCFNANFSKVALIKKKRPAWQAGCLNGIGGHVKAGESDLDAMNRKFTEETGAMVEYWQHYADMTSDAPNNRWVCHCFATNVSDDIFESIDTATDELVVKIPVNLIEYWKTLDNVKWLVHLAIGKLKNIDYAITIK